MKSKINLPMILLAVAALGIPIILTNIELPGDNYLWRVIANTGHIPLFGMFSLVMLVLSVKILGTSVRKRYLHYVISLAVAMVMGVISEFSQISGHRDADVWDLVRDIGGAISFLGLCMLFDHQMETSWKKWGRKAKALVALIIFLILSVGIAPMVLWAGAYWHRDNAYPEICGFDSLWETMFRKTKGAKLIVVAPPEKWKSSLGDRVGRLTFQPVTYSEITVLETDPDWTGYKYFTFEVYSELDSEIYLTLRIEDVYHNNRHDDRFNRRISVAPGLNQVAIPLLDIRTAPKQREMDMTAIRTFSLFAYKPVDTFTIYLDNFKLQ